MTATMTAPIVAPMMTALFESEAGEVDEGDRVGEDDVNEAVT